MRKIYVIVDGDYGRWYYNQHTGHLVSHSYNATRYDSIPDAIAVAERLRQRSGSRAQVLDLDLPGQSAELASKEWWDKAQAWDDYRAARKGVKR